MLGIDAITSYLLVVALLTLLVAVLIWQTHRSQRTIPVWLAAGAVGILLGSIGSFALAHLWGYELAKAVALPPGIAGGEGGAASGDPMGGMGGGMPGMGGGMPGMGGGMPGMGGGMFGGPRQPRPKRELTTLVRKLELATGDIGITLSAEQAVALSNSLKGVDEPETMSDDDAKAKHAEIFALLSEDQKGRLEAIGLPRTRRGGGPGGPGQDENANPFKQEANATALTSLRQRAAGGGQPSETPPAPK